MRERSEIISNATGLAAMAVLWATLFYSLPVLPETPKQPEKGVEVSLEAPPEEKPEAPKGEAAPPPPSNPEPPPPPPPPPPPENAPTAEQPAPAKTDEAPKPPEPLIDPDGQAAAAEKQRQAAAEQDASAFKACLQKKARYPSSKVGRKNKPHGTVIVSASISGGVITGVEVTKSSGSPILDEAAKTTVLNSGCGSQGGEASKAIGIITY